MLNALKLAAGGMLVLVMAGCTGNPAKDQTSQTPLAQQTPVGDQRQRAKAHGDLGLMYLQDGNLNVALEEARLAIEADPSYPLGFNLLGLVQMYLKDDAAAEENFSRALRMAPTDPDINNNYGWFLCQSGRPKQSLPYFTVAMKSNLYATPAKPLTNAGICAVGAKDEKAAEDYFLRAIRVDNRNIEAMFVLADLYYRNGRLNEALDRISQLHSLAEPTADTAWLGLRIERKLGNREAEARFAGQIRRRFQGSTAYQKLMQGQFE